MGGRDVIDFSGGAISTASNYTIDQRVVQEERDIRQWGEGEEKRKEGGNYLGGKQGWGKLGDNPNLNLKFER